jgi:hypothetical protein
LFAQFGDQVAVPLLGNFDPPLVHQGRAVAFEPNTNPDNALDVNADGQITPRDALIVLNVVNTGGEAAFSGSQTGLSFFTDVTGDGVTTALDVLQLVNYLNGETTLSAGEGEPEPRAGTAAAKFSQPRSAVPTQPLPGRGRPAEREADRAFADVVFRRQAELRRQGEPELGLFVIEPVLRDLVEDVAMAWENR